MAFALARAAVRVVIRISFVGGGARSIELPLADELSGLVLKAFAWRRRAAGKDIVDVWRMLEILAAADVQVADAPGVVAETRALIVSALGRMDAPGMVAIANEERLSGQEKHERFLRLEALMRRTGIRVEGR